MNLRVSSLILAPGLALDFQPDVVISLLDPKTELPNFSPAHHLHTRCFDTESNMDPWAVQRYQVEGIFSFVNSFAKQDDDRIMVVCNGGVSRSTATAIGLLVSRGMMPADATLAVFEQRPMLAPNKLILKLMDTHLRMDGKLIQQVQEALDTLPKDGLYLWCATCKNHFVDGDPNHICQGWTR